MLHKDLESLVESDSMLKVSYDYIRSVDQVALFPYSSGSSVRGRTKVHPMANKTLKKTLHMCALSAISGVGELKTYFDRKAKEGKNKMSIINPIRNKILQRIFACVKQGRIYTSCRLVTTN